MVFGIRALKYWALEPSELESQVAGTKHLMRMVSSRLHVRFPLDGLVGLYWMIRLVCILDGIFGTLELECMLGILKRT